MVAVSAARGSSGSCVAPHPRPSGPAASYAYDRQPPRLPDRSKQARPQLHRRGAQPGLGWPTSPTSPPAKVGSTSPQSWTCTPASWLDGPCARRCTPEIALDALNMAVQRQRPGPGLIHHSDRGIQYAAEAYRSALARSGITPSMSRKGDCWDDAPMESFVHTLKTERVHHRVYATRAEARRDLFGIHRGLLQSASPALGPGISQPSRDGTQSGLTPSTSSGEDHDDKSALSWRLQTTVGLHKPNPL